MEKAGDANLEFHEKNESLKRFQRIINASHPFGIRLWKPALYEKHRSIEGCTYHDLHSYPIDRVEWKIFFNPGNILWTLLFGWWLGLVYILVTVAIFLPLCLLASFVAQGMDVCGVDNSRLAYKIVQQLCLFGKCGKSMIDAGIYFIWPFGRLVKVREYDLSSDPNGAESSAPEIDYEDGAQSHHSSPVQNDDSTQHLLPYTSTNREPYNNKKYESMKIFMFTYRIIYVLFLAPFNILVSTSCMLLIFFIPMAQLNIKIMRYLYRRPFAAVFSREKNVNFLPLPSDLRSVSLRGRSYGMYTGRENLIDTILCVKSAVGRYYYKHTVNGINIVFVNLTFVAVFSLADYYGVSAIRGRPLAGDTVLFATSLISTVPLAYFIGMAVAFITSETGSLALGAVANATFGSIIEIILYILAIVNNEEKIVEGAIVGSLLASLLALPGLCMIFGSMKIPEQKFSLRLAGITCTTLIGATVATFLPTLFQSIFGSYAIYCSQNPGNSPDIPPLQFWKFGEKLVKMQGCTIIRERLDQDVVYNQNTTKLVYASSIVLILTYLIGLYYTLSGSGNTFASRRQAQYDRDAGGASLARKVKSYSGMLKTPNPTIQDNDKREYRHQGACSSKIVGDNIKSQQPTAGDELASHIAVGPSDENRSAPSSKNERNIDKTNSRDNWNILSDRSSDTARRTRPYSKKRSILKILLILMGCTAAYSFIAEIIVKTISNATEGLSVSSSILGITVFALVPMATEFYNAISFAMSKNMALGLEIGSAYMAQALMIQIPVLVIFSAYYYNNSRMLDDDGYLLRNPDVPREVAPNMGFTMIFSNWDMYVCLFASLVFLRVYIEGKSNFFKGAVLFMTYSVIITSYFLIPKV